MSKQTAVVTEVTPHTDLTDFHDSFAVVETTDGECWPGTIAADQDVLWVYSGLRGHPKMLVRDEIGSIQWLAHWWVDS